MERRGYADAGFGRFNYGSREFRSRGRQRSGDEISWRNRSAGKEFWSGKSREGEESWRRQAADVRFGHEDAATPTSRTPQRQLQTSAMRKGKIVTLNLNEGYGFLAPMGSEGKLNNVFFRFGDNSKSETGMLQLEKGDVFEYIVSNDLPDSPGANRYSNQSSNARAMYARLVRCSQRSPVALTDYMDALLMESEKAPGRVLREITKCPAGFLQVLNMDEPPIDVVRSVLQLANNLSDHNEVLSYTARLKLFYRVFSGTAFLRSSRSLITREWIEEMFGTLTEQMWTKRFLVRLLEHSPESLSDILPSLNVLIEATREENVPHCHCQFLLDLLRVQAGNSVSHAMDLPWNMMSLIPMDAELGDDLADELMSNSAVKGLPCVKKKGSYGSIEEYVDTYFRLLKEDCFLSLKKGICNLRKHKLDARDMRVWMNGFVLGIHFSKGNSGLTVAIQVERPCISRLPMAGSLVGLSDNGTNFESPIWGVVAHCEDQRKEGLVIFVEIVDGRGGAGDLEVQSIGRLMGASNSIVVAESPAYYKAYQPVLRALQQMDLQKFPFMEELVYAKWPNVPPQYLSPSTTFDWRCLFEDRRCLNGEECGSDSEEDGMRCSLREMDNLVKSGHRICMDESQLEAVKLALSNRLVLIQGPPGTGKTYVGAKILEILLSADTLPPGPIIILTYKNHALDQFLLSCLKFCGDLVRVGGQSTESSLQPYNLNSLVRNVDEFTSDFVDSSYKLEEAQEEMENCLKQLQKSNVVFDVESVICHMPDWQVKQIFSKLDQPYKDIIDRIPDDVPLADVIEGRPAKTKESSLLHRALSKCIKQWMPRVETLQLVENCLSFCHQTPRSSANKLIEAERPWDVEEDQNDFEERDWEDSDDLNEQLMWYSGRFRKRERNESWLDYNFFRFGAEDQNSYDQPLYSTVNRLNNIEVHQHRWLLNENPWDLNQYHRAILVHVIMQTNYEMALKRFGDVKKVYDEIRQDLKEIHMRRQLGVLREAKIVGMTTTGAAMHQDVLKYLHPSIIFIEEAAEILEPQVLASLGQNVQHLILIGDQYQLSPCIKCYELERWHDFGVSLFERLIEHNNMPFQALKVQSRMREEFLPMILPIYPFVQSNMKLVTGERNNSHVCMMSSMYFWSHSHKETRERSFSNEGEAKMVISLLRWMIAEGEVPNNISVLAAYNGQVSLLREKITEYQSIRAVEVHTIDRFQGSENKIIIISLVRSNQEGDIGFLANRNRFCVSVSRARGAVYFCGNDETLAKKSEHWRNLTNYFKDQECLGEEIYLCCQRHPLDPPIALCSRDVDSSFSPLLCERPCRSIYCCGHYCPSTCHLGAHPPCIEEVQFVFQSCGHSATKQCRDEERTQLCQEEISFTFKDCGHQDFFKCWRVSEKRGLLCQQACHRDLECGHPCTLKCFQDCKTKTCEFCLQIQKDKAQKEKLREGRELKLKLEEIEKEIERLKLEDDLGSASIIDINPEGDTAAEYMQVMDRTEKFIQPMHGVVPVVMKIQKVCNLQLQIKLLQAQKDLLSPTSPTQLLFHGTNDEGINGIIHQGFRLPPATKNNMFGQGCYFATDSTKSAQQIYTKGSNKLLLCEVLLGKTWMVQEAFPQMDGDGLKKKGYDSLFSKRGGKSTGGTLYDEFVIYNPHQAIPRYVVHYKNLSSFDPGALPSHTQHNLTRIPYEMLSNFSGDNLSEYHFRLAESQFFRMSSRNDHKVVKVELIINKTLQRQYEKARQEFEEQKKTVEEMLVFHGTDKDAIEKIIEEGFKIGGQGVEVRHGKAYGTGVYTALDPDTSIDYSKGGMILLSSALVGQEGIHYNKGGSPNVLVLRKTEHLLPKYIVHFTKK